MNRADFATAPCMVARGADVLGDHWTPLLLRDLGFGISRFDQLQNDLGLSRKVLAHRLRRMVADGLVERTAYQHNPERFDYRLTEMGEDLLSVVRMLRSFSEKWLVSDSGLPSRMVHTECGQAVGVVASCGGCGGVITTRNTQMIRGPGHVTGYFPELDRCLEPLAEPVGPTVRS